MRDGEIDLSTARLISKADFLEWTRRSRPQARDVLLSRRCYPGETAQVREHQIFAVGQNLVLLRSDGRRVAPAYLRWLTRGPFWWAEVERYRNPGAVFDSLKCADIVKFRLPIPPLRVQIGIADLLGSLDEKIELNRRMAATLEGMARAIFKSWFVDFDPVRAKTEGRPTFLPDDLAALFPDSFGPDGLPEGWERKRLSDFTDVDRETVDPSVLNDALVAHFSIPAFDAGRRPVLEPASAIKSLKLRLQPPVVLFSKLNPDTPRIWPILNTHATAMLASTEFVSLKPIPTRATFSFLTLLLSSKLFVSRAAGMVTGTSKSHQRVQVPSLLATDWVVPARVIANTFEATVAPLFGRADIYRIEADSLATLRDTLLPKLISGELRIADADQRIAAVA